MKIRILLILFLTINNLYARDIFVSSLGKDKNNGTSSNPIASIEKALSICAKFAGTEPVTIWFGEGSYYLSKTIQFNSVLSGTPENPITFSAIPGAKVVIKGSKKLNNLKWKKYKNDKKVFSHKLLLSKCSTCSRDSSIILKCCKVTNRII